MSHFSLRFSPSDEPKLIVSVSKKVAKKAVTRNLIKRRLRAVLSKMQLKSGTYLVIARKDAETVKGEALRKELESLIK